MKQMIKKISGGIVLLSLAGIVEATGAGGYFGLMLGQSNLNGQDQTITLSPGLTTKVQPEGSGVGARLFAGYGMNQYFALEGGFTYFSAMDYKTTIISNSIKTDAASFDLLGKIMFPFADTGFGIFGKVGGAYFVTKSNGNIDGFRIDTESSSVFRPVVGLGVSYDLTQNWVADLSYTSVRYSTSVIKNPSFIALGISYHLLDPKCGQFLC